MTKRKAAWTGMNWIRQEKTMDTTSKDTQERVRKGSECPRCGNAVMDTLVWKTDSTTPSASTTWPRASG